MAVPNIGPLPKGVYYLVDRQSGGFIGPTRDLFNRHGGSTDRRSWFTLWNPVSGDTTNIDGIKRGNFRLHPMGTLRLSEGCITSRIRTISTGCKSTFVRAGARCRSLERQ
nr:tlde1 domain-containing protein [Paraburkholderia aromaticivorans]